jgi:mRNA interferase RelE/StbE
LDWTIEFDERAIKELKKLGHEARRKVVGYLEKRIAGKENPRRFGKALSGDKAGLWRYRVDDYRVICRIEDQTMIVLVVRVGHRSEVYD